MNPRRFIQEQFDSADTMAKDAAVRLFCFHPIFRAVWTEDYYRDDPRAAYKTDLVLVDRSTCTHRYNLEVEVKSSWKSNQCFPYRDIQFVPRKKEKWTDPEYTYGKPTHWLLFNEDATRHLVVFDQQIREVDELRWVKCQVRGQEQLYCIDRSHAHFDYL